MQVGADWCRVCIGWRKRYLKYAAAHPNMLCLKLNAGKNPNIASRLNVSAMPLFVAWRGGVEIGRLHAKTTDELEEKLDALMAGSP